MTLCMKTDSNTNNFLILICLKCIQHMHAYTYLCKCTHAHTRTHTKLYFYCQFLAIKIPYRMHSSLDTSTRNDAYVDATKQKQTDGVTIAAPNILHKISYPFRIGYNTSIKHNM